MADYEQHKFAPNESEVLDFYAAIDDYLGQLLRFGAVVAITADHGMNGKCDAAGQTNVVYLESELVGRFGAGYRVICPITDPYVVHHGALGSAVMVHLPPDADQQAVARWILQRPGVSEVFGRSDAAEKLELPADRIGDLFVMSARNVVIGRTAADHDLSQLDRPLRSHGGRYEEMVPMILSRRLSPAYLDRARGDARNFDIFDFVCNGLALNVEC